MSRALFGGVLVLAVLAPTGCARKEKADTPGGPKVAPEQNKP